MGVSRGQVSALILIRHSPLVAFSWLTKPDGRCCLCRAYVDSRIQTIYGGTNEIMKELISRSIVGKA